MSTPAVSQIQRTNGLVHSCDAAAHVDLQSPFELPSYRCAPCIANRTGQVGVVPAVAVHWAYVHPRRFCGAHLGRLRETCFAPFADHNVSTGLNLAESFQSSQSVTSSVHHGDAQDTASQTNLAARFLLSYRVSKQDVWNQHTLAGYNAAARNANECPSA